MIRQFKRNNPEFKNRHDFDVFIEINNLIRKGHGINADGIEMSEYLIINDLHEFSIKNDSTRRLLNYHKFKN